MAASDLDSKVENFVQFQNNVLLDQGLESDDPDKAAHSYKVAQALGLPSTQVHDNPDSYDAILKRQASSRLLQGEPWMEKYVRSDPMATHVSSDDWSNLWSFSRAMDRLFTGVKVTDRKVVGEPLSLRPAGTGEFDLGRDWAAGVEAVKDAAYGFAVAPLKITGIMDPSEEGQALLDWADKQMRDHEWSPWVREASLWALKKEIGAGEAVLGVSPYLLSKLFKLAPIPGTVMIGGFGSFAGGVMHEEISKPVEKATGIPAQYTDWAIMALGLGLGFKHLHDMRTEGTRLSKVQDSMRQLDPFFPADKTPPVGANDITDHLHMRAAERNGEFFKDVATTAERTETKARSPDHMVMLIRGITGDAKIELNAKKIEELYGDKPIDADDGLLGFVKDLPDQMAQSKKDGGPIRVRADEFYGRVPAEVEKALRDDYRIDPDGMTTNEAKTMKEEGGDPITRKPPRAEIVNENSAWNVYVDGQKAKSFLSRGDAEDFLFKVAPEQSPEYAMQKAAGIDQFVYVESPGNEVNFTPGIGDMFGKMVIEMPKEMLRRIEKLRLKKEDARKDRELERALRRTKAENEPVWQERFDDILAEVREDMKEAPQYNLHQFFDNKTLAKTGESLPEIIKLDYNSVPKDMRDKIPRSWMVKKGGISPDKMAQLLSWEGGGQDMLESMSQLHRNAGKVGRAEYFNRLASNEAKTRLETRYGSPGKLTYSEALDHVTDSATFDITWEHLLAAAMKAKQPLELMNKESFRDTVITDMVSRPFSERVMEDAHREMGKAHREAVRAASIGKWDEVLIQQEKYAYNHVLAQEGKLLNKAIAQSKRFDKKFGNRVVENYNPEHVDRIHDIMYRTGSTVRDVDLTDLANTIARHDATRAQGGKYKGDWRGFWQENIEKGLPEQDWRYEAEHNPDMVVYKQLLDDPTWAQHPDKMTIGEWSAINDTKISVAKWGAEKYLETTTGQKARRDDILNDVVRQLEFFPEKVKKLDKLGIPKDDMRRPRLVPSMAELMQVEYMFERIARFDPNSAIMKYVIHPLMEAGAKARGFEVEYSRRLVEVKALASRLGIKMEEELPNTTFYRPEHLMFEKGKLTIPAGGTNYRTMTRWNLLAAMLNSGTESSRVKFAGGYGTTPDAMMDYIHLHAKKEDWEVVRAVWKILKDIKALEDEQNIRVSGTTVRSLPPASIDSPVIGRIRGEYYPMVYDRSDPRFARHLEDEDHFRNVKVRTSGGWEKERTGFVAPVSMSMSDISTHLARRLRVLAMKEPVLQASDIFYNDKFMKAMSNHMGPDLARMLDPYLKNVMGAPGWETAAVQGFEKWIEAIRRNTVQAIAGFSPMILSKHAPTALIHAIGEVGVGRFMEAMHHLVVNNQYATSKNNDFLYKGATIEGHEWPGAQELISRTHHWAETFRGGAETMMGRLPTVAEAKQYGLPRDATSWRVMKEELTRYGSWAIQTADMKIAEAVWMAKYSHVLEELGPTGMSGWEAHLEADRLASYAVRRALGSTAITSKPLLMQSRSVWYRSLTMFMGFFNNTLMRLMSAKWRTQDAFREFSQTGDGAKLVSEVGHSAKSLTYYFILTAFIEQLAEAAWKGTKDTTPMGMVGKSIAHLAFQVFPFGRGLWAGIEYNLNPGVVGGIDSGWDKVERFAQIIRHPDKYYRTKEGQHKAIGAFLDVLAVMRGVGNFQTSNWAEGALNVLRGNQRPQTPAQMRNLFMRGTIREPRRH